MPKFLPKFLRRRPKDPAAAGILSASSSAPTSAQAPQRKAKKEKKLSKRQAKKQKKKDKLGLFPSAGGGSDGYGWKSSGGGFGGVALGDGVPAVPGWEAEEQKENYNGAAQFDPRSPSAANNGHRNGSMGHRYESDFDSMYDKPALSIISEEERSRNNLASPTASHASGRSGGVRLASPRGAENGSGSNGFHNASYHSGGSGSTDPPQAPSTVNILSPMSGSKPPLTPNRTGHRANGGGGGSNGSSTNPGALTPGQFRSPGMGRHSPGKDGANVDMEVRHSTSPDDQSLRGVRIAGSEEMVLSADEEDEEYERLREGGPGTAKPKEKFVSALDRSPFSYASEEDDGALFPALADDTDPMWQRQGRRDASTSGRSSNGSAANRSAPPTGSLHILPMAHETQEDIRAWTPSPTKKGAFPFQGGGDNKGTAPPAKNHGGPKVVFETNFEDFEPFDPAVAGGGQFASASSRPSASKTVAHHSPVAALLEDSRARRKGSAAGAAGAAVPRPSASVNSAPVLNAGHVRGQIRSARGGSGSISRVIDNLELHVNKRHGATASGTKSHSSVTSASAGGSRSSGGGGGGGGASALREAKERIRRENMLNQEGRVIDLLAAGGAGARTAAATAAAAAATDKKDGWLFDEVAGTLGPRSAAADLESLGGRSNKSRTSLGGKSHRSGTSRRSHRSKKSSSRSGAAAPPGHRRHRSRGPRDDGASVDSRTSRNSRNSYRSYQTTKSMVSQMSEQSRSVANDLLRLEAQLSMVGKSRAGGGASTSGDASAGAPSVLSMTELRKRRDDCGMTVTSRDYSVGRSSRASRGYPSGSSGSRGGREHISASARRAAARTLRSKVTVVAPPGKLGIILANRTDSRGTVVSGVRTSSVLADQVSPGDRIVSIDGEDVGMMNVKEITTIMARKSEFERVLVLLAAPKYD